jgi:hypothetical protein
MLKISTIILICSSTVLVQFNSYCQSSDTSIKANTAQLNKGESVMEILDTLFIESNFEELTQVLIERSKQGDTSVLNYLSYLDYIADTIIELTKVEIQSKSYVVSIENIKLLDDFDYYLSRSDLGWNSFSQEISKLKCQFNTALQKQFSPDVDKAYKLFKSSTNIALAGQIIAESQFYRLKFFRDTCFDKLTYDISVKKIIEVSNWIEKSILDSKYQEIRDNQPPWVDMGMSYEEYQEWWAQQITAGSDYMGGGCNSCGKTLYRGKRGGIYKINSSGNKQYVPRKK